MLRDWAKWTPMEKVTYLAQLAAPLTLLATVIFSYLSWREAVEARHVASAANDQQQRFFISQNPPQIDLVSASAAEAGGKTWVFLTFKNIGGSEARSPCATIHGDLKLGGRSVEPTSCGGGGGNPYENRTVARNGTYLFYTPQSFLSVVPERFTVWRPGDPDPECKSKHSDVLLIDVNYYDLTGTKRSNYDQLMVCGK